jgi:hypothetical protein
LGFNRSQNITVTGCQSEHRSAISRKWPSDVPIDWLQERTESAVRMRQSNTAAINMAAPMENVSDSPRQKYVRVEKKERNNKSIFLGFLIAQV